MKRILTVTSQRAIHEQCEKAKSILAAQQLRDRLEAKAVSLEKSLEELKLKLNAIGTIPSLARNIYFGSYKKFEAELKATNEQLVKLRKTTTELVAPVWQYSRKYSDLPGALRWKKQWVRALEERKRSLVKLR